MNNPNESFRLSATRAFAECSVVKRHPGVAEFPAQLPASDSRECHFENDKAMLIATNTRGRVPNGSACHRHQSREAALTPAL